MSSNEKYTLDFSRPEKIYFVGIGGISMSGLAAILADAGFTVCGSDRSSSAITQGLEAKGIKIFYGQKYENITADIACVVFTSAIHPDNPEYRASVDLGLKTLTRAELLGQMMKNYNVPVAVSGTHGKTTTTSMISEILLAAGVDPTLSIGGVLPTIGGNVRVGGPEFFVTEACEYTNSFLSFFPKISIITNIEEDHLDFFKDLADIRNSFKRFAELLPDDGAMIIGGDIENYKEITGNLGCKVVTYGLDKTDYYGNPMDYYPENITYNELGRATFTAVCGDERREVSLQVPGEHNVINALGAIALADAMGIDHAKSAESVHNFKGTDRRFEYKGTVGGITVIDDYAHHPTEIMATLKVAQRIEHNKLWVVFQPHTFTRTKAFMKEFAQALSMADKVVLPDIYPARETDNLGISSNTLCEEIRKLGTDAVYIPSFEQIEKFLLENCTKDDMLITMGAGEAYKIGESLLGK